MQSNPIEARTKFVEPGKLTQGTITEVTVNQDPFHCTIKMLPKDPTMIQAEGRYSDHEVSLGKLRRNLVHLKFNIKDVGDTIAAVESLEGRECIFRVDKSGWVSWIASLLPIPHPELQPVPASVLEKTLEVYFVREPGKWSIYRIVDLKGEVRGWAVSPTGQGSPNPHGWVLNLATQEEAIQVLKQRKKSLTND